MTQICHVLLLPFFISYLYSARAPKRSPWVHPHCFLSVIHIAAKQFSHMGQTVLHPVGHPCHYRYASPFFLLSGGLWETFYTFKCLLLLNYMCVCMTACMCILMHEYRYPAKPGVWDPPGAGVTGNCELSQHECWEMNSGLVQEQYALCGLAISPGPTSYNLSPFLLFFPLLKGFIQHTCLLSLWIRLYTFLMQGLSQSRPLCPEYPLLLWCLLIILYLLAWLGFYLLRETISDHSELSACSFCAITLFLPPVIVILLMVLIIICNFISLLSLSSMNWTYVPLSTPSIRHPG